MRRGRHLRLSLAAGAALLAVPAAALGVADVSQAQGGLTVTVAAAGEDVDRHGLLIEPFRDATRDGWRVRQLAFGDARIAEHGGGGCFENPILNDVVCGGGRSSITVTGAPGAERLTIADSQAGGDADPGGVLPPAGDVTCISTPDTSGPIAVALGGGDDSFRGAAQGVCAAGFFPQPGFTPTSYTVRGGEGADDLRGGPGAQTLLGDGGADALRGNDGDDLLDGDQPSGPGLRRAGDLLDGGPGTDTVTYATVATPVGVIIGDGVAQDGPLGPASEGDEVTASVENVIGGNVSDAIVGSAAANRLTGGAGGNDSLDGRAGDDTLEGGAGDDSLSGGTGRDTFLPGDGNDVVDARGGTPESFGCGPGTDTAFVDLRDGRRLGGRGLLQLLGCETILASAVDDGPPARILGPRLRRRVSRLGPRTAIALLRA
jgi:Ca2+-binding RTX toxin-like protein